MVVLSHILIDEVASLNFDDVEMLDKFYSDKSVKIRIFILQVIAIVGGVNDVSQGWDVMSILRRFQRLYEEIRRRSQDVEIVISGILPRSVSNWKSTFGRDLDATAIQHANQTAYEINYYLHNLSKKMHKMTFLNWPEFEGRRDLLAVDGLHLSYNGNRLLARKLRDVCLLKSLASPKSAASPMSLATRKSESCAPPASPSVASPSSVACPKFVALQKPAASPTSVATLKSVSPAPPKSESLPATSRASVACPKSAASPKSAAL